MNPENQEPMIKFIAQTVEAMRERMATKEDLTRMVTRDTLDAGLAAVRSEIERVAMHVDSMDND
jgi:hypothetical protein